MIVLPGPVVDGDRVLIVDGKIVIIYSGSWKDEVFTN
jgi:hypothetical protein